MSKVHPLIYLSAGLIGVAGILSANAATRHSGEFSKMEPNSVSGHISRARNSAHYANNHALLTVKREKSPSSWAPGVNTQGIKRGTRVVKKNGVTRIVGPKAHASH